MVGDILQPTHLLFILVIALLVLGPKRLPEVGRTLGSGIRDFRQAISGESSNPLHDWSHSLHEDSEPELRDQVPDEADAETTAVPDTVGDEAQTAAATTAPVVQRPAVLPETGAQAQPAWPVPSTAAPVPRSAVPAATAQRPSGAASASRPGAPGTGRPVPPPRQPGRAQAGSSRVARPAGQQPRPVVATGRPPAQSGRRIVPPTRAAQYTPHRPARPAAPGPPAEPTTDQDV